MDSSPRRSFVTVMHRGFLMNNTQWVIDTKCFFHLDFLKLFDEKGLDESEHKTLYKGHQWEVTNSSLVDWEKLRNWILPIVKKQEIGNIKLKRSWCIEYGDGAFQAMHKHGANEISVVMTLDAQPQENKSGVLYTLRQDNDNKLLYKEFVPYQGLTVIMQGNVWHGVYPVKDPRRTFVADYEVL